MSETATSEMKVLEGKISELMGVLNGKGGDFAQLLRVEAAQTAWKISESLGPNSYPSTVAKMEKSFLGVLRTNPSDNNLEQESESNPGFKWLYASTNALVGIDTIDDQRKASVSDALILLREGQKNPRGEPWGEIGFRKSKTGNGGKQHIMWLKRILVSQSTFRGVIKSVADRIGQSRAAFARVTLEVFPNKRMPAFVRKQISQVVENGKSVYQDGTEQAAPFILLGSRAKGVQSNPVVNEKIVAGFRAATATLQAKIKKVIAGQSYNWNTGAVFKPTQFEE